MGTFYVNLAVQADAAEAFSELARAISDKGLVSPMEQGWMILLSEKLDHQEQAVINYYGEALSQRLGKPVLSVLNHDEDMLSVDLFQAGEMVTAYNSCPGYFKTHVTEDDMKPRLRGAEALAKLRDGVSVAEIETDLLLDADCALTVHATLANRLGLPLCSIGTGYRYAQKGEGGVIWKEIP